MGVSTPIFQRGNLTCRTSLWVWAHPYFKDGKPYLPPITVPVTAHLYFREETLLAVRHCWCEHTPMPEKGFFLSPYSLCQWKDNDLMERHSVRWGSRYAALIETVAWKNWPPLWTFARTISVRLTTAPRKRKMRSNLTKNDTQIVNRWRKRFWLVFGLWMGGERFKFRLADVSTLRLVHYALLLTPAYWKSSNTQDSWLSHFLLLWTPHLEFTPARP